jgi:signal transduction histidine kinase
MGVQRRPVRDADALAVTIVAWARVGFAIALAAGGALPDDLSSRQNALFVLLGLVWVPWSVLVLFASERQGNRWALVGGPAGDVLALFAIEVLATSTGVATLSGYLVVIAFTAYTVGRRAAGALAATAIGLAGLAQTLVPAHDRVGAGTVASFALAATAIVFLLDRTSARHSLASARADRLESTADAILGRIGDGVVVTGARGEILNCNAAAERILHQPSERLLGARCEVALSLHREERPLDCSGGCPLLGAMAPDDPLGIEVSRPVEGRRQPLLVNAAAVTDADGLVVEVVHSLRDVTRLKEAEEAKTLFLATASHELKTPLTVIRGFVEMLMQGDMTDDMQPMALNAVHRRTLELGEIVDRLLLSSRIEAGRVELVLGEFDVVTVAAERVLAMSSVTGRPIRFESATDLPVAVGDPAALATVLDHLLDNAVKYSPDGGDVTVAVDETDDGVLIRVSDQGIGMDDEQLAHCFDKFWQAETSDVRRFGGTGIGLYIVRSLVEAMGGTVEAVRGDDGGTVFHIRLHGPVADADAQEPARGESTMIGEFMRQIGVPAAGGDVRSGG